MKNKELVAALQRLDPEAEVLIDVRQFNKTYGKQLSLGQSLVAKGISSYELMVDGTYNGCTITVHLPGKAIIANWPKY